MYVSNIEMDEIFKFFPIYLYMIENNQRIKKEGDIKEKPDDKGVMYGINTKTRWL